MATEIEHLEETASRYDGMLRALGEPHAVLDIVLSAQDATSAEEALRQRYGFGALQAAAVLDMQFRRATKDDHQAIVEALRQVQDHLETLRDPSAWGRTAVRVQDSAIEGPGP